MYFSCGKDTNHWGPEGRLWWTDSRVALTFPTSCVWFLLSVNGTCEMLLIGRIWQRQLDMCDYVHMIILHKTAIRLARRPPLLCWLWRSKLPCHELPYASRSWRQPPADVSKKIKSSVDNLQETEYSNSCMSLEADMTPVKLLKSTGR